jgi:hypothetical protein
MPENQLPHNRQESDQDFLHRTALELAAMEFQRNLHRDDASWLDSGEGPEGMGSMECLMIWYRVYSTQAIAGRTLSERADAYRFLETLLLWTQGKLVYDGEGDDFTPHWQRTEDPPSDTPGTENAS